LIIRYIIIIYKTCKFSYFFPYINILDYVPAGEEVDFFPRWEEVVLFPCGEEVEKKKKKKPGVEVSFYPGGGEEAVFFRSTTFEPKKLEQLFLA
jgi:hypothetical protein